MASRKRRKDKQRSTKHTYKTKDRVTRTPLKTGGKLRCPGRESSSCSTSGSSIYVPSRLYLWGIVTGYDVNGNDVTGSDQKLHHLNSWTRIGNEREIISRGFFSPGFCRGFSGTSLDSRYGQWNCVSGHYSAITPYVKLFSSWIVQSAVTNGPSGKCMLLMLIYECIFYICSFLFVCLLVFDDAQKSWLCL